MSTLRAVSKSMNPFAGPTVTPINHNSYRGGAGMWFFNADGKGHDLHFSYSNHLSAVLAYENCAPVTAIINKKTKAYLNGKLWILNKSGKGKGKEATSEPAMKLRKLLKRPNSLQSWKEFEAQHYAYQQLFGFCIVLPIKPVGFPNIEATALWNIPPFMIEVTETEKLFYREPDNVIKKIVVKWQNDTGELDPKDIYIFKDTTLSFKSVVFPESRICALKMPINNVIGAYESRNVLINCRGALGILSPDAKDAAGPLPLKEEDKEDLQNEYARYGLMRGQWRIIISQAAVKWSQMVAPTKDLMLFEEIDDDIMRICDGYDYPYRLMSSDKGNSLAGSDVKEFKGLLYQDAIMPEAENIYGQWNEFFALDEYNLYMDKDFKHVGALQADELRAAQTRKWGNQAYMIEFFMNMLTLNQWLEKNGEDPLDGEDAELGTMRYHQLVSKGIVFGQITGQGDSSNQNSGGA